MKKSTISVSGKFFKSAAFLFGFIALASIAFTSCENFMKGGEVKEEIISIIDYNNAPSYTINVEALKGSGTIKTPVTGEVEKKVTDTFTVRFEPSDDCKFLKWEAIVKDLADGEDFTKYISFENPESLETKVTLLKASSKVIIIQPVCPPRLTYTMYQSSGGVYPRDSSIEFTFNQTLATETLSSNTNDYVTIQNLPQDTSAATYFKAPQINDEKLVFLADTSKGYIPVAGNSQRAINVKIPKDSIWYVYDKYLEPVKVYLDSDIKETYFVNSETSAKTEVKFELMQDAATEQPLGTLKIDGEENDGKKHSFSVGQTVSLRYKLPAGYKFEQWLFKNSEGKILKASDLSFSFSEQDYTDNLVTLNLTVDNYMAEQIIVVPEIFENLAITKFNLDDEEKLYERDSNIVITFNKPLVAECKDKISIKIPGLAKDKTTADYFEAAELNQNVLTIKTKKSAIENLIPLGADGTNTITISLPADDFYYEASSLDGSKVNVTLDNNKIYTYEINSSTSKKSKIKIQLDPANPYGTLKTGNVTRDDQIVEYNMGEKIDITYSLSKDELKDYYFRNWKVTHTYTESQNQTKTDEVALTDLESLNISLSSGLATSQNDIPLYGASIIIKDTIQGYITVQPIVSYIQDVEIKINGEHGKFSPAKGSQIYKIGTTNHIEYEPDTDYAFIRWQLVDSVTGNEFPKNQDGAYSYIRSTNLKSDKLDFEIIELPPAGTAFELHPLIAERPHVLSYWPMYDAADGSRSDTTIEIVFDRDMSPESILYSQQEVDMYEAMVGVTLKESKRYPGRFYGYEIAGETENDKELVLKNIQLVDKRSGLNIAKFFDEPTFEDAQTLFIPVKDKASLTAGMVVIVTISDGFCYEKELVPVSMSSSEKWRYLANGRSDTNRPTINSSQVPSFAIKDCDTYNISGRTEPVIGSNGSGLDTFAGYYLADGSTVSLTLKNILVSDSESYPTTMFTLAYTRIYDEYYNKLSTPEEITKTIDYDYALGQEAKYNIEESKAYKLINLEDGIYAVTYKFRDRSGNVRTIPDNGAPDDSAHDLTTTITDKAFYFVVDSHAPDLVANISEVTELRTTNKVTINVPALVWDSKDIKTAKLKYRLSGSSNTYNEKAITTFNSNVELTGLAVGKEYEVKVEITDYSGKTYNPEIITVKTKPEAPQNLTSEDVTYNSITLSWIAPTSTNFDNYKLYYKDASTNSYLSKTITKSTTSYELSGLNPRKKYNLYIVTESNGIQSESVSANAITKPAAATITNMKAQYDNTNYKRTFEITWTKPSSSSSYDSLTLYISNSADFNSYSSFDITNGSSKYIINSFNGGNLEVEKLYYTKIVSSATVDGTVVTNESVVRRNYSWLYNITTIEQDYSKTTESSIGLKWINQDIGSNSGIYLYYSYQNIQPQQIEYSGLGHDSRNAYYTVENLTPDTEYSFGIKRYRITDGNVSESDIKEIQNVKTYISPVTRFELIETSETYEFTWRNPDDIEYADIKLWAVKEGKDPVLLAHPEIKETIHGFGVVRTYPTSCSVNISDVTSKVNGSFNFALTIYEEGRSYGSSAYIPYSLPIKVTGLRCVRTYDSSSSLNQITISFDKIDGDDIYYKVYSWTGNNTSQMTPLPTLLSNSNADNNGLLRTSITTTNGQKVSIMVVVVDSNGNPYEGADLDDVSVSVSIPLPNLKVSNLMINSTFHKTISWINPSSGDYDGFLVHFGMNDVFVPKPENSLDYSAYTPISITSATVFVCYYGENGALGYNTPGVSK